MTNVTAEHVLACDDPFTAMELVRGVPYESVTPADVLACPHPVAAMELAERVPYGSVKPADVLACPHPLAALSLARGLPYGSVAPADVVACSRPGAARKLANRVPEGEQPPVLVRHGGYALRIHGHDPATCWVMAGCRAFRGADAALQHWDRDDERARVFTQAIRKWVEERQ